MLTKTETQTFVYATYIRTTPEKLWEALTSGEFSEKYWMAWRVAFETKADGDVRPQAGLRICHRGYAGSRRQAQRPLAREL